MVDGCVQDGAVFRGCGREDDLRGQDGGEGCHVQWGGFHDGWVDHADEIEGCHHGYGGVGILAFGEGEGCEDGALGDGIALDDLIGGDLGGEIGEGYAEVRGGDPGEQAGWLGHLVEAEVCFEDAGCVVEEGDVVAGCHAGRIDRSDVHGGKGVRTGIADGRVP